MAAEIIQIDPQNFAIQEYGVQDTNLIPSFDISTFITSGSYIESFIYDINQNILSSTYSFTQYNILNDGQLAGNNNLSQIILDPEQILINEGYDIGQYILYFNFLNKQIGSNIEPLYINEISSDRTEIRLDSTVLSNMDIVEKTNNFIQLRNNSEYFLDFYLNFGDNQLIIANNVQLDNQDPNNPTILIKLYEALPTQFNLNSTLWVVTTIEEPLGYQVNFEDNFIIFDDTLPLKGPNFNINVKDRINNSTTELSYTDLITTSLTSSYNQLSSLLEEKEININIDYTNFTNFIHFSSAQTRLENFFYKVSLIETYTSAINSLNNTVSSSLTIENNQSTLENQINNIITNFDGYEYYLYYETGSMAWPKITTQKPYELALTNSPEVESWFGSTNEYSPLYGGIILSASLYDNTNKDNLIYTIPEYLRDDNANEPYELFVNMVAQHYDNIWIYYKDVTEKYNADNRLEYGISKDIVADAIRDFGIKLYQNNFSNDDLYTAFLGLTPNGSLFPFPNITGSLPTPSGFEYIDTLISASNDTLPQDDVNKSLYKRIYHNLPYLLKSKGTLPGLRTLITSYGIPDTTLRINEYGGKDKININDWDYWQNEFNYAFKTEGNNFISSSFNNLNSEWNSADTCPETVMFRFKTDGLSTSNIPYSQSLWNKGGDVHLVLRYTGSGYASGSYSGSIIDPYYQYAHLDFYPNYTTTPNESASIYFPFFDNGWWSVMVTRDGSTSNFTLSAGNKIYEGGDNGTLLGFYSSSIITASVDNDWYNSGDSYFASSSIINGAQYTQFSGSLQEIRYYNVPLNENSFKDYVMNPSSIEGNSLNSGPNELAFRASLGGELYTGSVSIHPKVTGSWIPTSSFVGNSNFYFNSTPNFVRNEEYFFYDQPVVGIKNAISDKIRLVNNIMPEGNTLSAIKSLSQDLAISQSYTSNTNLLEVAFSPQNEINEDIMDQMGYFNIGEYIGDPRLRSSSDQSYPALDNLRNAYFEKYTKNYDLVDFIRLIKFFDNSLFKMIKDFIPARTSLASGIVIKQHILERNKYPQPQTNINSTTAYISSGSINNIPLTFQDISVSGTVAPQWNDYTPGTVEDFNGGTGGSFEIFNNISNISQSWIEHIQTPLGIVDITHNDQDEFYDGEFSGSIITATTQSLAQAYPLDNKSFNYTPIVYSNNNYNLPLGDEFTESQFLNPRTTPNSGEILMLDGWVKLFISQPPELGSSYIKIHKFDNDGIDNSTALGQITKLLIKLSLDLSYTEINILSINEFPNYYLYEVNTTPDQDDYILDYTVSASKSFPQILSPTPPQTIDQWNTSPGGTNLPHYGTPYFDSFFGSYTLENTPNIPLQITASIITNGDVPILMGSFGIFLNEKNPISETTFNISSPGIITTISASYYGIKGDIITLKVSRPSEGGGEVTLVSASLLITQSINPSPAENDSIIFEPYITTPNFYNSDFNPIINNVLVDRLNTIYQDVDYSTGITTPTNFALLISGSALKAAVQDSNYSSKRVTIPRYEGSKSTSQHLNVWTLGDKGTYGKLPTVESLKNAVAYCDNISGWTPERMNASGLLIKYLIKSDGTVVIPNTTPNSLADNKGIFETGENVEIQFKNIGGQVSPIRKVIRGGSRIEPILYSQFESAPNSQWNTTMSFTDIIPSNTGVADNYTATFLKTTNQIIILPITTKITFDTAIFGSSYFDNSTDSYVVSQDAIDDGITLIFNPSIKVSLYKELFFPQNPNSFPVNASVTLKLYKGSTYQGIFQTYPISLLPYEFIITQTLTFSSPISIPSTNFNVGDQYSLHIEFSTSTPESKLRIEPNSTFNITQYPIFTSPITSSGVNSIWGWPDKTNYPNVITSSNSTLGNPEIYGNPNVKAVDITGSGFNTIQLPWSIEYGDEFRFEGREDFTYQVGKVFGPSDSGSGRLFQTGSIEVHFNNPLPVSASSSTFNLDHFLIRRYVDDATTAIIEGFKPTNSNGPYIIKPEFVVPELDKSIDEFILDLTQKGLIT
jgi:hypothetical protein